MKFDSHYQLLWDKTKDLAVLEAAGWFDDSAWDGKLHLDTPTTPLLPLKEALSLGEEVGILYFPGCFAPLHAGHLSAMEKAREAVEAAHGIRIVLGLIAPEHPTYVDGKVKDSLYSASRRIAEAQRAVEGSSWLRIDSYPGLYGNTPLNFTRLLERTEVYLARHCPTLPVRTYLVFGSDNGYFSEALRPDRWGVCVARPGFSMPPARPNVLQVPDGGHDDASSALRASGFRYDEAETRPGSFLLRDDLSFAARGTLLEGREEEALTGLKDILSKHLPHGVGLMVLSAQEQVSVSFDRPTISLDPFYPGTYSLAVSRPFELAGGQWTTPPRLIARPGSASLDDQLDLIPPGEYLLVDDDYYTGTTMRLATELLAERGIVVSDWVGLANDRGPFYDVADARDFFPGLADGGLVVEDLRGFKRVPYCMPEVNLAARISLAPERAWKFSRRLRKLWKALGLEEV